MLKELHIKNIAVIDEINITFNNGFNVLTGETGAGKSILIDSINMALGGRISKDLVRTGENAAIVDAVFEINSDILPMLEDLDIDVEDETIIISRKLSSEGKSSCRINGRITPLAIVREVGSFLITIHGQNDNQSILSPKTHINLIDEYGKTRSQIQEYQDKYNEVKTIEKQLIDLNTDETEKKKLLELYNFQINEISLAKLKVNEEDELEKRRDFLANAEKIMSNANDAYNNLYGDDEVTNAYDLLADSVRNLEMIAQFDDKLNNYHETLASVLMDLEDITHDLKSYIDIIDFDSKELDAVEERLSTIYNLRRKYGNTIEEILKYYETIAIEVENIENSDELINVLTEKLECKKSELFEASNNLTNSRIVAAKDLQEKIMKELADLDMQKMNFKVSVTNFLDTNKNIKYTSLGKDNVEFLISGNLGEELKPLYKIASGGEMSRIMLAIKSVLADMDVVETLIFDEIDTGVSGRAAQKIAEKIASLSKKRQVLSITHLAQIASMADTHYLIEKTDDAIKTSTSIVKLDENGRKYELARIIGGVKVTDLTLDNAKEMLDLATKFKKS